MSIQICKQHKNKVPCDRISCEILESNNTEQIDEVGWIQIKQQERLNLLSKFKITECGLQSLVNDLCSKDVGGKDNFSLLLNALEGMYSENEGNNGVITLAQHLNQSGEYQDLILNTIKGQYDHNHSAECIDPGFYRL